MKTIFEEVTNSNRLYDMLLKHLITEYPQNDNKRVEKSRNYLLNIILTYDGRGYKIPSNIVRGVCAEVMFEIILRRYKVDNPNIVVMKNLIIPLDDNSTTQLDFLILTPTNITVVEVKSLFGIQFIEDGIVKCRWKDNNNVIQQTVTKPWGQNMLHIMALKKHLNLSGIYLQNMVFIFGVGRLHKYTSTKDQHLMVYENRTKMLDAVLQIDKPIIPKERMIEILKGLTKTIPSEKQEAMHVINLKKKYG